MLKCPEYGSLFCELCQANGLCQSDNYQLEGVETDGGSRGRCNESLMQMGTLEV